MQPHEVENLFEVLKSKLTVQEMYTLRKFIASEQDPQEHMEDLMDNYLADQDQLTLE